MTVVNLMGIHFIANRTSSIDPFARKCLSSVVGGRSPGY